jgi:hypothetical protein
MECAQLAQRYGGEPIGITLTVLRGFNYLLGQKFLCRGRPAFRVKRAAGNVICLAQRLGRLNVETAISEKRYDRSHKARPALGRASYVQLQLAPIIAASLRLRQRARTSASGQKRT